MNEQDFLNAVAGLSDDNRAILNKWIARQWQEDYDNAPVFVWVDGERYPVTCIDDQIAGHIDINVEVKP